VSEVTKRERWTPGEEGPEEQLCGGEVAERVIVTKDDEMPEHFVLTLDIGWAQTVIARCDYDHDASGVAQAVALALDCDVEWLA
jgi:hypothetical protein